MTNYSQSIDYFKKQAKALIRDFKAGDSTAISRVTKVLRNTSELTLMNAQHVVATEYGFGRWDEILKATAIQLKLAITLSKYPNLNSFGFGAYSPRSKSLAQQQAEIEENRQELRDLHEKVGLVVDWLQSKIAPIKTINSRRSSYGMKHVVEKDVGYTTNGTFIAAALICGYKMETYFSSPNASFAMSEKSWKLAEKEVREKRFK